MRSRFPALILGAALVATSVTAALTVSIAGAPPAGAAWDVTGIDVSRWQETIDWNAVNADGVDFAIMKATEGKRHIDPQFAANVVNAPAAGLTIGMYHVATPSRSTDDARAEANHFLSVAHPGVGNVIPALDIEISHVPDGMSPATLETWMRTWINRVTAKLGARPMVYGSQYLFETMLADTTWFADHGIKLWFAWPRTPLPPEIPANDWQGQGWTFWQWSWEGRINGISGDVDRDRFAGGNLTTARIAGITAQPGVGGSITDGADLSCRPAKTCLQAYSPGDTIALTASPNAGYSFVGWGGACASFGSDPHCSVTALGSKTVTATFSYTLRVLTKGNGRGSVSSSPKGIDCPSDCRSTFGPGAVVQLQAAPDAWSGVTWSGDCTGHDPDGCSVTMDRPRTVTATFPDLAAPSATIKPPGTRSSPLRVMFDEPVHRVTSKNVVVRQSGGRALAGTLRCRTAKGARTPCATGAVRVVTFVPASGWTKGRGYVTLVDPAGVARIVDRVGKAVPFTKRSFTV